MNFDLIVIAFSILAGISLWISDVFPNHLFCSVKYSLIIE